MGFPQVVVRYFPPALEAEGAMPDEMWEHVASRPAKLEVHGALQEVIGDAAALAGGAQVAGVADFRTWVPRVPDSSRFLRGANSGTEVCALFSGCEP